MEEFQRTVLTIAIILLLLTLIFIGFSLRRAKSNMSWPPILSKCPDYWTDTSAKGDGSSCENTQKLGINTASCGGKPVDFSAPAFSGSLGACAKRKWAINCSTQPSGSSIIPNGPVTWDGITYGIADPCAKPTAP